ncbi:helicase-related protein [Massilimicrobiota sp. An80]|uniref:helicase-related protein n=1 Tax=Massilimicrobiota sp. An80 TaxID=1965658 RepID=UPI000B42FCA8|nr:helicase-related protein [Massilimicrobiota sp. An80]OUN31766.1 hypothetical protein B5G32_12535 [Massilimicrobiota sp. An80]
MRNTDLTVFTNKNEDGIKLSDRLNILLTNSKYFDVLVGYFRISGFYLIQEQLEDIEEIRILIGLGTDIDTIKAVDIFELSGHNAIQSIQMKVIEEFNATSDDNLNMENGIIKFCEWINTGKLHIRMCFEKNVHAKLYIVRKNPDIVPDQFGNLITGSSNFTFNGLDKNIEFNVELKDQVNVRYALDFFDELWQKSKEITTEILDTIKNDTWMNKNISPYELFLKTIFVYFEEEIQTRKIDYDWPDGYMKLQYQEDAVTQARKILAKHGGVIISDVVGLGKTYIAAMLGKLLDGRKLFIVPPVVKDNWEHVLSEFGYKKSDKVVSLGIVDQVAQWDDLASFKHVFVDEAHRFRNSSSTEFQYLKKICYGKGVVLITATPQNNTILDIANLITLFQDSRNSSIIPDNKDLDKYFSELHKELKLSKNDPKTISRVASNVRDKVLRHVLIRRTRTEISKYYKEDLEKQNLHFPKLEDPIRLDYMYDVEMDQAFNTTIELLKKFSYARYAPLLYLKDKKRVGSDKARQENMKGFIKTLLVKRLESSIYAFLSTVKNIMNSSEGFISLYESGRVVVGSASHTKYSFSDFEQMDEEIFKLTIDSSNVESYKPSDFEDDYIDKVIRDHELLKEIYELWNSLDIQNRDSKYDLLKEKIRLLNKEKIIIFSEAKDTVDYLFKKLKNDFGDVVIDFSGKDSMEKKRFIQYNFDPLFDKKEINDKRILIATDTLSEGINLHKASILINYDLPWNPTRIMQRVGRINRVGSKNEILHVYNFFPRANTREHLSLEDAIKVKIQMFNELLGEDSKTITNDENVKSYNLYDFLMMANKLPDEEAMNSNALQMTYIQKINDIIQNNPKLADKIQKLPDKIRVAKSTNEDSKLITFIKKGWIKKFIKYENGVSNEIDFEEAINYLESNEKEKSISIPENYFDGLDSNRRLFSNIIDNSKSNSIGTSQSPNEKKVRQYINALLNLTTISVNDRTYLEKVNAAIIRGSLNSRIFKDVKKEIDKNTSSVDDLIKAFKTIIDDVYLMERDNYDVTNSLKKPDIIVLSEYLTREK